MIRRNGVLTVHYVVRPQVRAAWLLFVGMTLRTAQEMKNLRWLGLGSLNAYPNQNGAAILGLWSEKPGHGDAGDVKATRWAELTDAAGAGVRVDGASYIRTGDGAELQVLSSVAGRPSKNHLPDDPDQCHYANRGSTFAGAWSISLLGKRIEVVNRATRQTVEIWRFDETCSPILTTTTATR